MAAAVELCESNESTGESITHNVTNLNWGTVDEPNTVYANHPVTAGQNAMFKLERIHLTALNGSNKIDNIQIWKSNGNYVTDESIKSVWHTVQGNYDTYKVTAYSQPNTTTMSGYAIPIADPGSANLGIGGSLTGSLIAAGYSDYWKWQTQTLGTTPPGNTNQKTMTLQYDEQ